MFLHFFSRKRDLFFLGGGGLSKSGFYPSPGKKFEDTHVDNLATKMHGKMSEIYLIPGDDVGENSIKKFFVLFPRLQIVMIAMT
jgi:hypothetical protein